MTIGEKIKRLRQEKGMTQEELGKAIGVQKAAINKYELGIVVNLKKEKISQLAKALDVNPVWLMDDDETWPPMPSTKTLIARAIEEDMANAGQLHTAEARILAKGIDKMPKEQREAIMNLMIGLYPGIFEKENHNDDT